MNCETSNEEQKNDVKINRGQTVWENIKKAFRNIEHFLNKQKYIREVMLALCISLMVFIVFLVQTFHDAEEFENTEIGVQLIYEQEELVKEYNIIPYLDTILSEKNEDGIAPYFRERGFLDPNYQYKIRIGNKSFQVFSNWNVQYANTIEDVYYNLSSENEEMQSVMICIESYLNKEMIQEGKIYKYYSIFTKIHNNMNGIMTLLIVLFGFALILILNVTGLCIKKDEKVRTEWRNKIPLEVNLILTSAAVLNLILIESEKGQLYQISYLSYGTILLELFASILPAILMVETAIFRLADRTLLKHSIVGFLFSSIGKKIKPICSNMSQKKKVVFIILTVLVLEGIYLAAVIAICMDFNEDKIVYLLILLPGIINLFYMLDLYSKLHKIHMVAKKLQNGEGNEKVDTDGLNGIFYEHAECINHISDGLKNAIAEKMKSEKLKIELITNVSHDIKTPLTSIINYVDLMKKENIENQKIKDYLEILEKQSFRLKDLTDHVIEASKAATGNVEVKMTEINVGEMLSQALGEYENKFSQINLQTIYEPGESVYMALGDGALLWRVLDNLFSNVRKYTLEGTRFYVDISEKEEFCMISLKNISKYRLNISAEELSQRFVRGDASRNTKGNGLGLSIAQSLISLQGGEFTLEMNGDLFIATIFLRRTDINS